GPAIGSRIVRLHRGEVAVVVPTEDVDQTVEAGGRGRIGARGEHVGFADPGVATSQATIIGHGNAEADAAFLGVGMAAADGEGVAVLGDRARAWDRAIAPVDRGRIVTGRLGSAGVRERSDRAAEQLTLA